VTVTSARWWKAACCWVCFSTYFQVLPLRVFANLLASLARKPQGQGDSADRAESCGGDVKGDSGSTGRGKTDQQEVISEGQDQDGGVQNTDSEQTKRTGLKGKVK